MQEGDSYNPRYSFVHTFVCMSNVDSKVIRDHQRAGPSGTRVGRSMIEYIHTAWLVYCELFMQELIVDKQIDATTAARLKQ
jgi:hypothetical protein